jgi:hypothetical protein
MAGLRLSSSAQDRFQHVEEGWDSGADRQVNALCACWNRQTGIRDHQRVQMTHPGDHVRQRLV